MKTGQLFCRSFFILMVQGLDFPWKTTEQTEKLAIGISYILTENPQGSGEFIVEDLTVSPNKSLLFKDYHLKYFLYTREIDGMYINKKKISKMKFDPSKETVFIIHGWKNSYQSPMPQTVKDAYLLNRDANVIIVDWFKFANLGYATAKFSITNVGRLIGEFMRLMIEKTGLKLENTGLVGHSLGAHIAGIAGRTLNGDVSHLIGLDPAGPLFYFSASDDKLNSTDAKYVQVIHTCAGILGYPFSLGDADYWPNGGFPIQPNCGWDLSEYWIGKRYI